MSDSSSSSKKKGWPRGRKRNIKVKDVNAPKMPMSGYMLFLNDHRERVRSANPGATFSDMTRLLANAWQAAPPDEKQRYMEAAQHDRERYNQELQKYQQTDSYREFNQSVKNKTAKRPVRSPVQSSQLAHQQQPFKSPQEQQTTDSTRDSVAVCVQSLQPAAYLTSNQPKIKPELCAGAATVVLPNSGVSASLSSNGTDKDSFAFDVPIFSEEFLSYNNERDAELRELRRLITDQEEQNASLQKHIDGVQEAVEALEKESSEQRGHNAALQQHLGQLRTALAEHFSNIPPNLLPDAGLPPPTSLNIDEFINRLHEAVSSHEDPPTDANCQVKAAVRAVIDGLNLH